MNSRKYWKSLALRLTSYWWQIYLSFAFGALIYNLYNVLTKHIIELRDIALLLLSIMILVVFMPIILISKLSTSFGIYSDDMARHLTRMRSTLEAIAKHMGVKVGCYVWVNTRCINAEVTRVEDVNGIKRIYVRCRRRLMTHLGCPDNCSGFEEARPSGGLAFAGLVIGGILGLPLGPAGILLGGLLGGGLGVALEGSLPITRLQAELNKCRIEGKTPEVVVETY